MLEVQERVERGDEGYKGRTGIKDDGLPLLLVAHLLTPGPTQQFPNWDTLLATHPWTGKLRLRKLQKAKVHNSFLCSPAKQTGSELQICGDSALPALSCILAEVCSTRKDRHPQDLFVGKQLEDGRTLPDYDYDDIQKGLILPLAGGGSVP
ncbi:hypothetical protein BS17DRAFT_811547 [Gyrodon lividus]|nr:hypothetical protein BS17DRAFT_811547 [Gyrodon lividus]